MGASRLVSAGRGSTSGSGRCPSAFRGPSPDAARRSTWEPRGSFLLQALDGARARFAARFCWWAALQALDGARARFGAPSLDAARRSTWEPRGSFLLAGAALQALDGPRARFGAPRLDAAIGSLAARFCWQGQHFRLWTVPERVSGPPLLRRSTRGSTSALDGARARFGAPPRDAARRSTWEPRGSFLLAGAALQALDGTCCQAQHLGASRLVSAGRGSTSGSGRYPSAFRGLGSLAARFCWQGQHFRLWTVPERVSGPPPPLMLPGAALGLPPPP